MCSMKMSSEGPKMPDSSSRHKLRHCPECGRQFRPSDETAEARPLGLPQAQGLEKERSAEPLALAVAGMRSSGEREPVDEYSSDEPDELEETRRTNWRSPPFT